jgi:hypothetical protein
MLTPKKRKALAKAMNETNVEEQKPEIPKMEIKREMAKPEEATGSIYSRKGKKEGESYYENVLSSGKRYNEGPYEKDVVMPYKRTITPKGTTLEPYRMKKRG